MPAIDTAKILILATDGYERSELRVPLEKLSTQGADVKIASPKSDPIKSWDDKNWGDTVDVDVEVKNVDGFLFLQEEHPAYDVIIFDLPDPREESLTKL